MSYIFAVRVELMTRGCRVINFRKCRVFESRVCRIFSEWFWVIPVLFNRRVRVLFCLVMCRSNSIFAEFFWVFMCVVVQFYLINVAEFCIFLAPVCFLWPCTGWFNLCTHWMVCSDWAFGCLPSWGLLWLCISLMSILGFNCCRNVWVLVAKSF